VGFGHALSQKLEATLRQVDHFALVIVLSEVVFGFDLAVCNLLDHLNNLVGLADQSDQGLVFGFEEL
jgi:hypothetical protein